MTNGGCVDNSPEQVFLGFPREEGAAFPAAGDTLVHNAPARQQDVDNLVLGQGLFLGKK